jgi:hypothetical protein
VTTLTLTLILCLFTNTIFEWVLLHLTSMTKHIHNIFKWNILKGQRRFFFQQLFGQRSWFDQWRVFGTFGHGILCSWIKCLLMGGCLMISAITRGLNIHN